MAYVRWFQTLLQFHDMGLSCQVYFKEVSEADMAVEMLNGRMFGRKVIDAQLEYFLRPSTVFEAGDGGGDVGRSDKVQNGRVEGGGGEEAGGVGELSQGGRR